jgi:RNA polymerase sigma-70 factor (ECF subfamily)
MSVKQAAHRFRTTRWALVVSAGEHNGEASAALAELCEIYWAPVYAFIRRSGLSAEDARDLTQAFFTRVIEKNFFRDARPDRGRFRSYLLACLRHFMSNARDARHASKRGGNCPHVSFDLEAGERIVELDSVDDLSPDRIYERRWVMTVIDQALAKVELRYSTSGRAALFSSLKASLTGDETRSYKELATEMAMSEGALRVAVHRIRSEFGKALRDTIGETTGDPSDVDDELRYLLDVVGGLPRRR